jgi:hypothetical protein
MASKRYVQPNDGGGWDVLKEGHNRATAHASTQADAIAHARKLVRAEGGGEIRVMNRFGKVVDSDTVAPRRSAA